MSQTETAFSDCDGTLINSEVICSRAYVTIFREFDVHVDLEEIFTRFKGVKLYEIIDTINEEQGATMVQTGAEHAYRTKVVRLSGAELEDIAGANELLASINMSVCVVSNSPVSKVQHSLGKLNMLHCFSEELFSGCDIQRWKSDPALIFHAAEVMNVNVENCILVDDSSAGAQLGIDTGMKAFYFCAGPYNKPIVHSKVTTLTRLSQLPELWKVCGWNITA